jgi:hypothetical protein
MTELSEAALAYLGQGLHLLALSGKRPNPRYHSKGEDDEVGWSWDRSIHGEPETAEDIQALIEVFDHPSTTGIAILIPEGVLVADVDTEEAATLLQELAPEPIESVVAMTTKGYHLWYAADGANRSVWLGGRTLLFKGFGGYVAAPPSRHFADEERKVQDGGYTWLRPPAPVIGWWIFGISDLPSGVAHALEMQAKLDALKPAREAPAGASLVVLTDAEGHWTWKGHADWNIEGLRQAIIKAGDGNQNNMIAWAAMQARDEGVPFDAAMKELLSAALEGHHPRHRAVQTIRGAYGRRARA